MTLTLKTTLQFLHKTCQLLMSSWVDLHVVGMLQSHHHHHQSRNREGRWGTTDNFATGFLHFSLFSTALWDLANSRSVRSLMLSTHLFLCLPCLLPHFTVLCKMVLARPHLFTGLVFPPKMKSIKSPKKLVGLAMTSAEMPFLFIFSPDNIISDLRFKAGRQMAGVIPCSVSASGHIALSSSQFVVSFWKKTFFSGLWMLVIWITEREKGEGETDRHSERERDRQTETERANLSSTTLIRSIQPPPSGIQLKKHNNNNKKQCDVGIPILYRNGFRAGMHLHDQRRRKPEVAFPSGMQKLRTPRQRENVLLTNVYASATIVRHLLLHSVAHFCCGKLS